MRFAPRLLLSGSGAEQGWADLVARPDRRLVRIPDLSRAVANAVQEVMRASGGEAVANFSDREEGLELLLAGSMADFSQLCSRLPGLSPSLDELAAELTALLDHFETPPAFLAGRSCRLSLDRPRIMGVLNVTPDSFSDGGRYTSLEAALRRGVEMAEEGADLIDIGGESTRPGARAVSAQEEIDRVAPVIEALHREIDRPLSIDTSKAVVARAAVQSGAEFINDISGLRFDPEMATTAAESGAGLFLMHTRGRPDQMQRNTSYADLVGEVLDYLREGLAMARAAGIPAEKLAVDPGIGFGKDVDGNLELLRRLRELTVLGHPILLGTSRKSFLVRLLGQPAPERRLAGTLATVALGVAGGAHLFRVHDVRAAREAAVVAWAICDRAKAGSVKAIVPVVES